MAKKGLTMIGSNVQIKGTIASAGELRIDGQVEADVNHNGLVIIGPEGAMVGSVRANTMQVSGEVRGTLTTTDRLELLKGARVNGDIRAAKLKVEEGAVFSGRSLMGGEEDAPPDQIGPEALRRAE
ncbi:MAG: bactofilin family protein [Bacillota bacterium]